MESRQNRKLLRHQELSLIHISEPTRLRRISYAVTAADLKPLHADNRFVKFADDTYLVVPANSVHTRAVELDHSGVGDREQLDAEYAQDEGSHFPRQPPTSQRPVAVTAAWRRP